MDTVTKIEINQVTNKDKKEEILIKHQKELSVENTDKPIFKIKNIENEKTKLEENTGGKKKVSVDENMTKASVKAISLIVVAVILFIVFILVIRKRQRKIFTNKKKPSFTHNSTQV